MLFSKSFKRAETLLSKNVVENASEEELAKMGIAQLVVGESVLCHEG